VFPADNVWNTNIAGLPVDPDSATWLASMDSSTTKLHPDFGPSGDPAIPYGIPYTVVSPTTPLESISFQYSDQSDPGPYPFTADTPIEGGANSTGDRHAIMVNPATCTLYELWDAHYSASGSKAGSGAIWDLDSDALRPAGWTSADAAGLPILPGLVNYDEASSGAMDHAIRFTAQCTQESYIWPARHEAGQANSSCPPMGARFRLDANFSLPASSCDAMCQTIITTMKTYGLILADNGSNWFFQGVADTRWTDTDVGELKQIPASAFQAVDESCLMVDSGSGQALQPGAGAYDASCPNELVITSAASTTAQIGSPFDFTVQSAGSPTPSLQESGALPAGVTFTDNGDGTGSLAGTPAPGTAGSYPITISATNGADPDAVQDLTFNVVTTPTITSVSPSSGPSAGGTSVTISGSSYIGVTSVTVGGNPVENLSVTSPDSMTITTPTGTVGSADVVVTAAGGDVTDAGAFTYVLSDCDPPVITSPDSVTAVAAEPITFTVTTCSTAVPVIKAARLPAGLRLVNNGDGTATISGTPSTRDSGIYMATVTASVPTQPAAEQSLTVAVENGPIFRSKPKYTASTGVPFTYPITTLYGYPAPTITSSTLPNGLTLTDLDNGTAILAGTAAEGDGGIHSITLTATNGIASVNQTYILTVDQAPEITSPTSDTITAGQSMMPFTVTDSGFPTPSLRATGLPSGVRLKDNRNLTGTISGTPAATAAGTYHAVITAVGRAGATTGSFTLTIDP